MLLFLISIIGLIVGYWLADLAIKVISLAWTAWRVYKLKSRKVHTQYDY